MIKILIPTDFSKIADNAVNYALSLIRTVNGELTFFHANVPEGDDSLTSLHKELSKSGLSNLTPEANFISTDRLFNSATIKELHLDAVDLIIMGTSGENKNFSERIFGTNTSEMIENLNCPVLAVPEHYRFKSIHKIGYATDLNNLNDEIVKVIEFAKPFKAAIEIFHVSPIFPDLGDTEKMDVNSSIETLKERHDYPNIHYSIEKTPRDNQVNKGIHTFLSDHDLDLLVLFHNNQEGIDRFITSSASENMIKEIKSPVLIFPKINV